MQLQNLDWTFVDTRALHFNGRYWVFEKVRDFLMGPPGIFLIVGAPGTGKTAIAARLIQASADPSRLDPDPTKLVPPERPPLLVGTVQGGYFCRVGQVEILDVAQRISDQLAVNVPGFAQTLLSYLTGTKAINLNNISVSTGAVASGASIFGVRIDLKRFGAEEAFAQGVDVPLQRIREEGNKNRIVLLVDALDETLARGQTSNLPKLLSEVEDVHMILTTRPDERILSLFEDQAQIVDLIRDAPQNIDDIRAYCEFRLQQIQDPGARQLLSHRISLEASGIFLYAFYVLENLISSNKIRPDLNVSDTSQIQLPKGLLPGVYRDFIRRVVGTSLDLWRSDFAPVLGPIAVAPGGKLSIDQLAGIAPRLTTHSMPKNEIRRIIALTSQFLEGPLPDGPFGSYHASFAHFLIDPRESLDYVIDALESREAIVDHLLELTKDADSQKRESAAASLAKFGDNMPSDRINQVLDRLVELIGDSSGRVHRAATDCLAAVRDVIPQERLGQLTDYLLTRTQDPNTTVSRTAVFSLKALKDVIPVDKGDIVMDRLFELASGDDGLTRRAAALTLADINRVIPPSRLDSMIDCLIKLTNDDCGAVRAASASALAEVKERIPPIRKGAIVTVILGLVNDLDGDVRASASVAQSALVKDPN